ncbi:uncharacterized protein LOC134683032 [Mytilus trossulus]|uniref:uncharacterized protein LOC134683032 n=1 Tax=Mytilus trossulus TaxID=6551 RepID=UPI003007A0C0
MCYFGVITLWLTFLYMYPDNVNILEGLLTKICKCEVSKMKRSISVCKGASFFLMTVLLLIILFVISNPRDNSSKNLAMLCSVALLFGITVSVLCLNIKEADVQPARTVPSDTNPEEISTSRLVAIEGQPVPTATTAPASQETLTSETALPRQANEGPSHRSVLKCPLKRDHVSRSTEDRKGYSPLRTAEMETEESTTSIEREETQ